MRDTGCIFGLIVTKICICPGNGSRMGEFQYGSYKTYSLYDISNTNFFGSPYF